jgi:hypothetical protein
MNQDDYDTLIYDDADVNDSFNGLAASELVLGRDWNTPEEDAAWLRL